LTVPNDFQQVTMMQENFLGFSPQDIDWRGLLDTAQAWVLPRLIESTLQLLAVAAVFMVARWVLRRVESRVTSRTQTHIDDILMMAITRCVLMSIGFWGAWRLANIWEQAGLGSVIVTIWIVAFSLPISRFLTDILKMLEERVVAKTKTKLDDTALPWINRGVQLLVVGTAVMIGLHNLGINITPLLAGASVAGFAVSFAAKDTLANIIAGILLVIDRPFEVGDRIELWETPVNQSGWGDVIEIGLRATKIRTPDNIVVIIPNSVITNRDIVNWTAGDDTVRLRIPIGIAYDAPAEKAKELLLDIALSCPDVLNDPEPVCITRNFGASSVDLELRVWLRDARRRRAVGDWITDRVKTAFDNNGIEIPYPKRDLYIRSAPDGQATALTPTAGDGTGTKREKASE
jgi:small-conductance mechanosensitive channel